MALPAEISNRVEDLGVDLVLAGGAVMLAIVAFWALRKLGQKMGWWGGVGGRGGHLVASSSAVAALMRSCG